MELFSTDAPVSLAHSSAGGRPLSLMMTDGLGNSLRTPADRQQLFEEVENYQPRLPVSPPLQNNCCLSAGGSQRVAETVSHHEAEWPVLQLTNVPKTPGRPLRKAPSRHKVVWFDASIRHVPSVFPIAKPKNWQAPLCRRRCCPGCHGLLSKKVVFQFGANCLNLLLGPSSSWFPCSRQDSAGSFSSTRIVVSVFDPLGGERPAESCLEHGNQEEDGPSKRLRQFAPN